MIKKGKRSIHIKKKHNVTGKGKTKILKKMPRKHHKTLKRSKSGISKSQKSLLELIQNTIKNSKGVKKSQNNLASKLIQLANKNNMHNMENMQHTSSGSSSYSKAVQSSYTSINKNGVKQEYGQTIKNESTQPYIEIRKLQNGIVNYYKISRQ
jgi:hypothetical protein